MLTEEITRFALPELVTVISIGTLDVLICWLAKVAGFGLTTAAGAGGGPPTRPL